MQVRLVIYPGPQSNPAPGAARGRNDLTLLEHTEIPIEGVDVVHVITEVCEDDPGYAFSDVTLQRYVGGRLAEPTALTGSVCESPIALSMHEHWCYPERLINCVRGDSKALHILDIDYGLDIDEPIPSPDESQRSGPGPTPRVRSLIARAESRLVRTSRPSSARIAGQR
jgi:hypothetical protein